MSGYSFYYFPMAEKVNLPLPPLSNTTSFSQQELLNLLFYNFCGSSTMVLLLCSPPASSLIQGSAWSVCSVKLILTCVLLRSLPLVTTISGFRRAALGQKVTDAGSKSSASSSLKSHDGKSGNSCFIYECAQDAMSLSPHPEMLTTKNWAEFHSNKVIYPNKLSIQKTLGILCLPQLNEVFYF